MTENKQELIEQFHKWHAGWESLVRQVGEESMAQPGRNGGWSLKDLIAHLAFWWGFEAHRLEAALGGDPPPDSHNLDQVNRDVYNQNKDRPVAAVLADARAACQRIEAALHALPDQALFEVDRYPWAAGLPLGPEVLAALHEHMYDEHGDDIEYWRSQI